MVAAALNGSLDNIEFVKDPIFNLSIPTFCPGVPSEILNPKNTWDDKEAYEKAAKNLATRFAENFKKYKDVTEEIKKSGPNV